VPAIVELGQRALDKPKNLWYKGTTAVKGHVVIIDTETGGIDQQRHVPLLGVVALDTATFG
jgi:magnesium-transporting ATPase (P-type)